MSKTKIGTAEAILIILTIVITHSILSLPRNLINTTKSSIILNLLFVTIIAILLGLLIYHLLKNFSSLDIVDISEFLGGKILKNIIGGIFIFHFIISSSFLLRGFCEGLKIVYFPMTDIVFIIFLFIIAMCISNRLGFNVTLKSNLIIIPLTLISIIFLFFTNIQHFTPQRIFPILGDGILQTFVYGLSNLYAFGGIAYLYFLPPHLKQPEKLKKIALISIIISGIYLILCVSLILFIFTSFITTNEIMPLYSAARYIQFGTFFQRLESLLLLIWIVTFISYLSIACKFSVNIFKKLTNIQNGKPLINIFGLLILGISLIPKDLAIYNFFETHIYNLLVLGIVLVLGIGILILANIKKGKQKVGD